MVGSIIMLLALCSGGICGSVILKRKFSQTLPLSFMGIVVTVYCFGLFHYLRLGAIITVGAYIVSGIISIFFLGKRKQKPLEKFRSIDLSALAAFLVAFCVLVYISYKRIPAAWDEFSHWAFAPKAMFFLNDFGTNPESNMQFQSYPPGMAIFQYCFLLWNDMFTSSGFLEWPLYVAYGIACISLLLAFIPDMNQYGCKQRVFYTALITIALALLPLVGFYLYSSLYIDGFLAVLSAYALFGIIHHPGDPRYACLNVSLSVFALVLTKDAGLYFAGMIIVINAIILWRGRKTSNSSPAKQILCGVIPVVSLLLSKLTWNYEILINNVSKAFSAPIRLSAIHDVIFNVGNVGILREVVKNFILAFLGNVLTLNLGTFQIAGSTISPQLATTTFFMYYIMFSLLTILLTVKYKKEKSIFAFDASIILPSSIVIVAGYIMGLCLTYMFKFEGGTAWLPSYERYMMIAYIFWALILAFAFFHYIAEHTGKTLKICLITACVVLLIANTGSVLTLALRKPSNAFQTWQEIYPILKDIDTEIPEDASVYIISQEDSGYDYWSLRYLMFPRTVNPNFSWSIGEPSGADDSWTHPLSAEQWMDALKDYDYLVLYRVNAYFLDHYQECFADGGGIIAPSIYQINPVTGRLETL